MATPESALPIGLISISLTWGLVNRYLACRPLALLADDDGNNTPRLVSDNPLAAEQDQVLAQDVDSRTNDSLATPAQAVRGVVFSGLIVALAAVLAALHATAWAIDSQSFESLAWAASWVYSGFVAGIPMQHMGARDVHIAIFALPHFTVHGYEAWTVITRSDPEQEGLIFAQFFVGMCIVLLLLGKPRWSEAMRVSQHVCNGNSKRPTAPDAGASLLSRAFFSFVTAHLWSHRNKSYTLDTVPDLDSSLRASELVSQFRSQSLAHRRLPARLVLYLWRQLLWQVFVSVITGVVAIIPSWALQHLLAFLALRWDALHDPVGSRPSPPWYQGLKWVVTLFAASVFHAILYTHTVWVGRTIQSRVRGVLTAEVVGKTLRRSHVGAPRDTPAEENSDSSAGHEADDRDDLDKGMRASDGRVMTLLSVDVSSVASQLAVLHNLFPLAEVQIAGSLFMLLRLVG